MIDDDSRQDPGGLREGEIAVELPEQFDASLYFIGRIRTPWKRREECPKNPRETGRGVHHRARSALGRRAAAASTASATSSCCIGWTGRGATSCCRRRTIIPSVAARLRSARRCGPIRSPFRWRGFFASKATSSRSSASIVSTTRRFSTQAVFRLDRFGAGRVRRLACGEQAIRADALSPRWGEEGWGEGGLWLGSNRGHGPHPLRSARDLSRGRERGRVCRMGGAKRYPSSGVEDE